MKGKVGAISAEAVHASVAPDIGAVAAVLAEFNIVDVRFGSRLEDEHEFMLRTIERSHAAIGLGPDTDIFQLMTGLPAGFRRHGANPMH